MCIKLLWEIDWSFHSSAELNDYLNILDPTLNKCEGLKGLKDLVGRMENVEIGKIAPDFEMNDINENIVKLSDLYSKSNYLLLDFWASHCGPCRKENANYNITMHLPMEIARIWMEPLKDKPELFSNPYVFTKLREKKVFYINTKQAV